MAEPCQLVALHGFAGSGADFDPLRGEGIDLAWHTPDLPGHGTNLPADPDAYRIPDIARVVGGLLGSVPRPRILLGYSMGGRIALRAALDRPDLLDALVLVGASPGLADEPDRRARIAQDDALAAHVESVGVQAFAAEWARVPLIATQRRIAEPWRSAMTARRARNDCAGLARSLRLTGTGRMEPLHHRLAALTCPTLLVVGEQDPKFRSIAQVMRLPQSQLCVLPGAGHAAHLERPAAFLAALRGWCADVLGMC